MKPVYANTTPRMGGQVAGLASIDVAPKEWLATDPHVNFNTGVINNPVTLLPGKTWISLQFTQDSYLFEQKAKSNKSGAYQEISFSGTTNDLDPDSQQVFETLRYHQLVARIKDRQKRMRLIGNQDAGMLFQVSDREGNQSAGTKVITVEMMLESEYLAPFYLPKDSGTGPVNGNDPVGISPLFLSALINNSISGNVNTLFDFYTARTTSSIVDVYNILVTQATHAVINIAIANAAGLQKSEYLAGVDLSSLNAFISYLNAWLYINGTGQYLQMQGTELRLFDPTSTLAYIGIAIPKNLLAADNNVLLLAY